MSTEDVEEAYRRFPGDDTQSGATRYGFLEGRKALREAVLEETEACALIAERFAEVSAKLDGGIGKNTTAAGMLRIAQSIRSRKEERERTL
jgi:hypothetical protein